MSHFVRKFGILLLVSLVLMTACKKKKPTVPQPQSQAPTITQPAPPLPQPQPEPQPPATATTTTPPPPPPATAKPKPKKHHAARKPAAPAPEPAPEKNKTVKEGGDNAPAAQLSAGIPQGEASRQRQSTAQLRQTTETSLRNLNRQLSGDEQAMVQQIRTYLAQSKTADNDGDTERAYNLAFKAHLLAEELTRR